MSNVKIKICGITNEYEIDCLNENKVDFAGFVLFFQKSKRNLDINRAKSLINKLDKNIKSVAVTVSPTVDQLNQIVAAGFDYIQVHGELLYEVMEQSQIPVIRAFNIDDMDKLSLYGSYKNIVGYVFDAHEPGSGKTFDWNLLNELPRDGKLFLLAGGLNPENVKTAIDFVKPDGVDVSSGVEYTDKLGKDIEKINAFVKNCRV